MSAQVAADLRAAAEVLRRDGWAPDWFETPDGCKCTLGALGTAIGDDPECEFPEDSGLDVRFNEAVIRLRAVIGTGWIVNWNDTPGRTADEVIAALEAAADAAEAVTP